MWRFLLIAILVGEFGLSSLTPAHAQSLTVKNFINPDAPLVREALVLIEGDNFTDGFYFDASVTQTTLGGVQVLADNVPQRLRSAATNRLVFLLDAAGQPARTLEVRPKTGAPLTTQITLVNAWPGVVLQSTDETDNNAYIPSGNYSNDLSLPSLPPLTGDPLPVATNRDTVVVLNGSGWRFATNVSVRLNGTPCRVQSFGPGPFTGQDVLTFLIPPLLADIGPVDLVISVAGRESNYARLVLGHQPSGTPNVFPRKGTRKTTQK